MADEALLNSCGKCEAEPEEICADGIDNDCDQAADEDCPLCMGITCLAPPPIECADENTRRQYLADGWCDQGSCQYPYEDLDCMFGCLGGTCQEDPCLEIVCDNPGLCQSLPGSCNTGSCDYPPTTACMDDDQCCPAECNAGDDNDCTCPDGTHPCADGCCPWQIELLDGEKGAGQYQVSVVMDSAGRLLACYSNYNGDLKLAQKTTGPWVSERVDEGVYCSLAIGSNNHPHISYSNFRDGSVRYAFWNGSDWTKRVVDTPVVGQNSYSSLSLDANQHPYISFSWNDDYQGEVKVAFFDGNSWETRSLDSGKFCAWTAQVRSPDSSPRIGYMISANMQLTLKYVVNIMELSSIQVISSDADITMAFGLSVDSSNHPHASFLSSKSVSLMEANWSGAGWELEKITPMYTAGGFSASSLKLGKDDVPRVGYYDEANQALKYAYRSAHGWKDLVVDPGPGVGRYNSLVLDASNLPWLVYYDEANKRLLAAQW